MRTPAAERTPFYESARYARARTWILIGLALLSVVAVLVWPFVTNYYSYNATYYDSLVVSAAISAILTMSLNLAMGFGGMLSMVHTGLQLVGGYALAAMVIKLGLSWVIGLGLAAVVGAVVAVAIISVSLRATYLYFGMITLAANLIIVEIGRVWDPVTGGVVGIAGVYPEIGGELMSKRTFYYVVVAILVLVYIVTRNVVRSDVGRSAMAVRESADSASAMGIWPARAKVVLFGISGAVAGLAGGLYALHLGFINPDVGLMENGLIFFLGLFLGGISTFVGPIVGVAAIALLVELIKSYERYTTLVLGSLLLLSMVVIPRGIVGTWNGSRWGRNRLEPDPRDGRMGPVPESVPEVESRADGPPALVGRGLVKHFGGVRAVDGIDFELVAGRIHGVIGPNGSGKSTLIGCLTRYHRLDGGEVRVAGETAPAAPHRLAAAGVTRVFQVPHLFDRVSVLDNVLTGMHRRQRYSWWGAVLRSPAYRRSDRSARAEAQELLEFAGLGGKSAWLASSLSHGQKRLLEVVRAVATHPRVLILDEPATGLTGEELDGLVRLCRALSDRGIAILIVEHNIELVMGVCDEVTVIESGRVIAHGDPAAVREAPEVIDAYLGGTDLLEESM